MEDAFDEREKGFEAKFKLDQELRFKAGSRRNKLIGLWAAERMGMDAEAGHAYAMEVVRADAGEPGTGAVVAKVVEDLAAHGIAVGEAEVAAELERLYAIALDQVRAEYPMPLGDDHQRTGG
jgi:hypothetical protein